ncbi:hypothetical protein [Brevibacterium zhoupengii]|uniref:hypothetical protein n=1 Tax=Brevibacterium zhoupengii TaxID=2898795 RepID=UPI001E42243B|nr:hypothetical protein [Brevibacterium zhoupengii]
MSANSDAKPMLCEVCGRFAELEWHSISTDYETVEQCSASVVSGGTGYWLCSDLCHTTAHELMKDETGEGRSAKVIGAMVRRLAEAVSAKARKYHKKGRTNGR